MSLKDKYYPWAKTISGDFAVNVATLFGLGKLTAPGTWGSLAGIALYPLLFNQLNVPAYIFLASVLAYFAVGLCDAAENHLNVRDPGMINLDEFVAMPVCYFGLFGQTYNFWGLLLGFGLFRFFDIKKPSLIYKVQSLEGGLGCVADDIVAGFATAICLNLISIVFSFITY
jgi:phosphatidylglycerophosphatase A